MTATNIAHAFDSATVAPVDSTFALSLPMTPASPRIEVAQTADDVMDAWRLVYESYRAKGLIDPHRFRCHTVPQAVQPGTTVTTKQRAGETVASISCYRDGWQGLPLDHVYRQDLDRLRQQGHRIGEIGLFAEQDDQPNCGARELFAFMRYPIYALHYQKIDQAVIGVHPRHAAFYRGMLGFVTAGATRRYSLVRNNPVVLLRFDLHKLDANDSAPRGLRYWRQHRIEAETFKHRFDFAPMKLAHTRLPAYLDWLAEDDAAQIMPQSPPAVRRRAAVCA